MNKKTYIIGEIGQNHNGSMDIARQIIDMSIQPIQDDFFNEALPPIDAVKLTKRDLNEELSQKGMEQLYNSPNSFGKTYGEHRAVLELDDQQHYELYQYAKSKGLDFVETLCARGCLSLLKLFTPDYLKVASRDLTNLPLLDSMAETQIPIIISTGMAGPKELDNALTIISKHHDKITILHCLSQYPAYYPNLNLETIHFLQKNYGQYTIGYSDHSIGIMIPVAAVAMGAKVIEKHITLDRKMKGSDHAGSLEKDGLRRMIRDIRNLERSMGQEEMFISNAVKVAQTKLERSIASARMIPQNTIIQEEDLCLLSPGDGFKWNEIHELIGKKAKTNIPAKEIIYSEMIMDNLK